MLLFRVTKQASANVADTTFNKKFEKEISVGFELGKYPNKSSGCVATRQSSSKPVVCLKLQEGKQRKSICGLSTSQDSVSRHMEAITLNEVTVD